MKTVLLTNKYTGIPLEILKGACPEGLQVKTLPEATHEELLNAAPEADYFLVSGRLSIDAEVLSHAPRLKMIQRTGVGTEMLDTEAIQKAEIPVYVNAGVNAQSVAEHTLTLILACLKRLPEVNRQTHQGIWKKQQTGVTTRELGGKTVAMVGMGNIGRKVAALLQAFGASVIYTDVIRQDAGTEQRLGLTYFDSFVSMLPEADILSFHCPLTPENTRMLNRETLSLMKKGAIVVNTARGKLIDPEALYDDLCAGHLAAAGLDTHFEEPPQEGYRLAGLDNVILTPHIGGLSHEAFEGMMRGAMENIAAFDAGQREEIAGKRIL